MFLINETIKKEITINKSLFISTIMRVNSIDEVNSYLSDIKKQYYDATHNCYAYILGENQDIQKCSDDGEPSKTAGYPMLEVLKKQNLTNVLVVVTRYFGGILLGAGGLVRAYSKSVSNALDGVCLYIKQNVNKYQITTDYSTYNVIKYLIDSIKLFDSFFSTDVKLIIGIPLNKSSELIKKITDFAKGKIAISLIDTIQEEISVADTSA